MLGPPGKLECLMLTPPTRLTHKKPCTMIIYVCLFIFSHAILLLMVYPRLPWELSLTEFLLAILCMVFMLLSSFTKPGYIKNEVDFYDLVRVIEATQLCPDCETVRTSRSRHCAICHQCVERFDHHCPWINNCVGVNNHNYFIIYLYLQSAVLLLGFPMCIWTIYILATDENHFSPFFVNFDWLVKL